MPDGIAHFTDLWSKMGELRESRRYRRTYGRDADHSAAYTAAHLRELDGAMHSVWLHGKWRWLTEQMTTAQREAAWAAVKRHSAIINDGTGNELSDVSAWWRKKTDP